MAEYIEREKLLNAMEEMCNRVCDYSPAQRHFMCGCCPLGSAIELVEEFSVADVQPVKHGRWVKARGSWCTPGGDPVWECSECGKGMHVYGIEHGAYGSDVADGQWVACPNCGARMDGE